MLCVCVLAREVNTGLVRVRHECFSYIVLAFGRDSYFWHHFGGIGKDWIFSTFPNFRNVGVKWDLNGIRMGQGIGPSTPPHHLALSTKRLLQTGQHRSTVIFTCFDRNQSEKLPRSVLPVAKVPFGLVISVYHLHQILKGLKNMP